MNARGINRQNTRYAEGFRNLLGDCFVFACSQMHFISDMISLGVGVLLLPAFGGAGQRSGANDNTRRQTTKNSTLRTLQ